MQVWDDGPLEEKPSVRRRLWGLALMVLGLVLMFFTRDRND